jgi:transposase InsO family protein
VEPLGKGCDRSVRTPELLQNAASGGVRERAERGIEVDLAILYHMVQYTTWVTALQWEAKRPLRCPGDPPKLTINGEGMRRLVRLATAYQIHPASVHNRVHLARDKGEGPPSYWVVYRAVSSLPADLITLAREGSKAYGESFELIHRREAEGPNAIWQADHTPLDILVLRPDGRAVNPWLTIVIDDYSRAVAGYFLSFEAPCSLHTSIALRQAIWRKGDSRWVVYGIPDVLYTDNGSDFTSRHLEQVGADLKIRLVFSIPGRPRGRGRIERFFSTVNEMFLCELEGYAPPGGKVRGKPTLPLEEVGLATDSCGEFTAG